jgi:hypothetical protein
MEISTDMLTQFGLMSKISTGHAFLDMMLCLLVPVLLQRLLPALKDLFQYLFHKPIPVQQCFRRTIEFAQKNSYYYYYHGSQEDPPNSILQAALIAYFNTLPGAQ